MKIPVLALLVIIPMAVLSEDRVTSKTSSTTITSDNSRIDFRTGINTFTGNVKVDHTAFELEADEIVEIRSSGSTQQVTATGSPVRFKQKQPFSEKISHGQAQKIMYDAQAQEVKMWDYVVTDIEGTVMRGKEAVYVLLTESGT